MAPKAAHDEDEAGTSSGPGYTVKVPSFDPQTMAMKDFRRRVAVFKIRTRMPVEKQAAELYGELKGDAWIHAEDIDPTILQDKEGIQTLLDFVAE
eukprot:2389686-Pyramimonas_sp.AAC.1